jgi:hypothetical protein
MFGLAKYPRPGLALLTLIPAFLILSYVSLAVLDHRGVESLDFNST